MEETVTPFKPDYSALFEALAKAQGSFPTIPRDKTVKVTMKSGGTYTFAYAPLDTILAAVRPHLSANGLAVMQTMDENSVWTIITHSSGVQLKLAPVKVLQTESGPQALGSALTYARRYSVTLALNLAADEDDDANGAQGNKAESQGKKNSQQLAKSAAPKDSAPKEIVEPTKARIELLNELGQIFHGRVDEMADALRTYSTFTGNAGEKFLTLANLEHPTDNDKMHKWFGSALGKLRKDVEGKFDQHKNDKLRELKEDMRVE